MREMIRSYVIYPMELFSGRLPISDELMMIEEDIFD